MLVFSANIMVEAGGFIPLPCTKVMEEDGVICFDCGTVTASSITVEDTNNLQLCDVLTFSPKPCP